MRARFVEPEILDSLPPDHPDAVRSRRDLRRLNAWMRNRAHVFDAITGLRNPPKTIAEIGAGDGTFLLAIAKHMRAKGAPPSAGLTFYLLDREPVVSQETLASFRGLGFGAEVIRADLQEWLADPHPAQVDLIIANLFLHHFVDRDLRHVFDRISGITPAFVACEPRRWLPSVAATHLLWAIGCNHVTRHDAVVSVLAGFRDREISSLWPNNLGISIMEFPAGYASHLFVAERLETTM
jgi:hypothetical protein